MSRTSALPVLIAGGGIGGLATAIALAQRDIPSIVYEKRSDAREAGAGIQIGPHGVKILRALGLAEMLVPLAGVPEAIVVRNGSTGHEITRLPLGAWIEQRHGAPYWLLHRADLHNALRTVASQYPLIAIQAGTEVDSAINQADKVTATLKSQHHQTEASGRALIGADGIGSAVRQTFAKQRTPRWSQTSAARAVFARPATGAFAEPVVTLWLSQRSHVVHYPVRNGQEISAVAFARDHDHHVNLRPETGEALVHRLGAAAPELTQALRAVSEWDKWPVVGCNRPDYAVSGRIALLGDAAHPIRPYLAQGAVMALEDATAIARHVAQAGNAMPEALKLYAAERHPRVARVAKTSFINGVSYHLPWPLSPMRNAVLSNIGGERLMASYDWLYGA
jgi:salicylate hydroxylase